METVTNTTQPTREYAQYPDGARFVVRATAHPAEDLERNFSGFAGNYHPCEPVCELVFASAAEASSYSRAALAKWFAVDESDYESQSEFIEALRRNCGSDALLIEEAGWGYHPAFNGYVPIHFHGLGAEELDASDIASAIALAQELYGADPYGLTVTTTSGSGHFYARECVGYEKVNDDLYVFVLI